MDSNIDIPKAKDKRSKRAKGKDQSIPLLDKVTNQGQERSTDSEASDNPDRLMVNHPTPSEKRELPRDLLQSLNAQERVSVPISRFTKPDNPLQSVLRNIQEKDMATTSESDAPSQSTTDSEFENVALAPSPRKRSNTTTATNVQPQAPSHTNNQDDSTKSSPTKKQDPVSIASRKQEIPKIVSWFAGSSNHTVGSNKPKASKPHDLNISTNRRESLSSKSDNSQSFERTYTEYPFTPKTAIRRESITASSSGSRSSNHGHNRARRSSSELESSFTNSPPRAPRPRMTGINPFLLLLDELQMERVFFDPELDVLNRFCLEYTEMCRATLRSSSMFSRTLPHIERVYNYMREETESASTPVVIKAPPVDRPVLHFELFLDHFRASSTRIHDPKVPLPHFTHGHRLTERRFQDIVKGIFARRAFLGSSLGVSSDDFSKIS